MLLECNAWGLLNEWMNEWSKKENYLLTYDIANYHNRHRHYHHHARCFVTSSLSLTPKFHYITVKPRAKREKSFFHVLHAFQYIILVNICRYMYKWMYLCKLWKQIVIHTSGTNINTCSFLVVNVLLEQNWAHKHRKENPMTIETGHIVHFACLHISPLSTHTFL